jgi:hypothetical protein
MKSALSVLLVLAAVAPAGAQVVTTGRGPETVETVERVVAPEAAASPALRNRDDVRIVRPGAMVFASYDADSDGTVTDAEVAQGAARSFMAADRDGDGVLSGLEQGDWATRVGAGPDVLSNPMLFDADLDRQVTQAEFVAGMQRLAAQQKRPGADSVQLRDMIRRVDERGQD